MKIDLEADQKLASGIVDLMMDAHERGVDGMLAIVTVAAGRLNAISLQIGRIIEATQPPTGRSQRLPPPVDSRGQQAARPVGRLLKFSACQRFTELTQFPNRFTEAARRS